MAQLVLIGILLAVVVTRRFSLLWGGVLALIAALGVGAWGLWVMSEGGAVAFLGTKIPREVFLAAIAAWVAFEGWGIQRALRIRRRRGEEP